MTCSITHWPIEMTAGSIASAACTGLDVPLQKVSSEREQFYSFLCATGNKEKLQWLSMVLHGQKLLYHMRGAGPPFALAKRIWATAKVRSESYRIKKQKVQSSPTSIKMAAEWKVVTSHGGTARNRKLSRSETMRCRVFSCAIGITSLAGKLSLVPFMLMESYASGSIHHGEKGLAFAAQATHAALDEIMQEGCGSRHCHCSFTAGEQHVKGRA